MIYQLSNKQDKTSAKGTVYVSACLTDESGVEYAANAFRGEFAGETFIGDLEKNGNFYNLVTPKAVAGGNYKNLQTEKLMDKKADNIAVAQNNKENGIRIASTMSGAVALAVAQFKNEPNDLRTLEELVEYFRKYLWLEWENINHLPPFK